MEISTAEKDVGVIIDNKLSFNQHITEKSQQRKFCLWSCTPVIITENVQRSSDSNGDRIVKISYEDNLRTLKFPTLKYRRLRGNMIDTLKILIDLYYYDKIQPVKLRKKNTSKGHIEEFTKEVTSTTSGHTKTIFKQRARLDIRKYSFTNGIVIA